MRELQIQSIIRKKRRFFKDKFLYLSAVQDIYYNEIVVWKLSRCNDLQLVLKTLDLAAQKRDLYGTIIHSRKGNCHDNACIESFFSHFKSEMFNLNSYQNEKELVQAIETYMYHYNYKRFQKRLNHRAPIEYRISMAA
ncbi:hypothetical protein IIU_06107 [Bacillus cereus VD133]|uniref:Integrase catalytic domain-containing protein n=2 Tax=Bacillus cereus TaxID=1396 RepID=A0A9W5UZM3_BACCE|nr:hypothetical protein IIU_06107 [Bacillus cereus VD133]